MNLNVKNKVFAFDLDGTLVNSKKELNDSTRKAIKDLIDNGAYIVLASGRTYEGILPLAKELELDKNGGFICAFNGGLVKNPLNGDVIFDKKFSCEEALKIHDFLVKNNLASLTYYKDNIITTEPITDYVRYEEKCLGFSAQQVTSIEPYVKDGVNKLLGADDPVKIKKVEQLIKNEFEDVEAYTSADFFLEILPKGIFKSKSLKILLDHLGLDENDLFTFGDGNNDISMLDFAHTSIVMENASDEVKKHGTHITHSCDSDGISFAINNILEGKWK